MLCTAETEVQESKIISEIDHIQNLNALQHSQQATESLAHSDLYRLPQSVFEHFKASSALVARHQILTPFIYNKSRLPLGVDSPLFMFEDEAFLGQHKPNTYIRHGRGSLLSRMPNGACCLFEGYWRDGVKSGYGRVT